MSWHLQWALLCNCLNCELQSASSQTPNASGLQCWCEKHNPICLQTQPHNQMCQLRIAELCFLLKPNRPLFMPTAGALADVDALEDASLSFHWCWELRTFTGLPKAVKAHADAARKHRKQVGGRPSAGVGRGPGWQAGRQVRRLERGQQGRGAAYANARPTGCAAGPGGCMCCGGLWRGAAWSALIPGFPSFLASCEVHAFIWWGTAQQSPNTSLVCQIILQYCKFCLKALLFFNVPSRCWTG